MGEIGLPRREFLYEVRFWEVRRIIKGYRRRDILTYQLLRINAYASYFGLRDNKMHLSPQQWLPLEFDEESHDDEPPITAEDQQELIELMASVNNAKTADKR